MTQQDIHSFGFGIATRNAAGKIIEAYYPQPLLSPDPRAIALIAGAAGASSTVNSVLELGACDLATLRSQLEESGQEFLASQLTSLAGAGDRLIGFLMVDDTKPASVAEGFFKLHLLSHRLALPNSLNLEGLFGLLHNLAWTSEGPIELEDLQQRQVASRLAGRPLDIVTVDKFPRMTSYVVPPGVRIADTARVRLGAYLGDGSTVMHEGFVNFNAGSAGKAMIEGRISASVMVGEGSDLGGGCSIMGTLSGGGKEVISVGENCLIGANAGIGFSLGNRCTVEAGLYVTAGTKIRVLDSSGELIRTAKARELSRKDDLLFRRNSLTGAVECIPNATGIALNEELHSHN